MNQRPGRGGMWRCVLLGLVSVCCVPGSAWAGWKAGTSKVAITPKQPTWMSGYGARNKPSEGAIHDLWAKALAVEDPSGKRFLMITLDVVGVDRDFSVAVRDALEARHGISRDRVVLACSHTHCGPVVGRNLLTMYELDDEQRRRIVEYTAFLEAALIEISGNAIASLEQATIGWGNGQCDFAVNRRANKEAEVPALRRALALKGPIDHDVPVLEVKRADGSAMAILFGYACHCTVMDFYKFCGDYAGFAQIDLESRYPRAQAMFIAGCGADQNPIPRRKLELAEAYGKQLGASVSRVLAGKLNAAESGMQSTYEEIDLALDKLPELPEIERDAKGDNRFLARRARHLLGLIAKNGKLDATYPYPILTWRIGELNWVFLGGEVVVDFALRIKRNLGTSHTWTSAYCNDVMAYIPSKRVLDEGGYEGGGAMIYYGLPTRWSDQVEEAIIGEVTRQVGR
jgi:neutral ceramidase